MSFDLEAFAEAFAGAPRPSPDVIAAHECCECDRVRTDFERHTVADVPDEIVEYHADSLPLLTPMAFRYFLPRYVRLTCEKPDTNATDFVLFNLSPDDPESEFWSGRCDSFTRRECEAIVAYLEYRRTWPTADVDERWIGPALAFWRHLIRTRS